MAWSDGLYIGKIIECEYVDAEDGTRLTAVRDGKMPAERERQETVEGEAETVRETWYQSPLGFGLYLDAQAYTVTEDEEAQSAVIEPLDGLEGAALYIFRAGDRVRGCASDDAAGAVRGNERVRRGRSL